MSVIVCTAVIVCGHHFDPLRMFVSRDRYSCVCELPSSRVIVLSSASTMKVAAVQHMHCYMLSDLCYTCPGSL